MNMINFDYTDRFLAIIVLLTVSVCMSASKKKQNTVVYVMDSDTVPPYDAIYAPHLLLKPPGTCDFIVDKLECFVDEKNTVSIQLIDIYPDAEFMGADVSACKIIDKLSIPQCLSHNNINYRVSGIRDWAFVTPRGSGGVGCASDRRKQEVLLFNTICIADGVERIGEGAFSGVGASNILFPQETLSYIGARAFACNYLETIQLPPSVKSIGKYAFCMNPLLKEVYWPSSVDTIPIYCFAKCLMLDTVHNIEDIKYIGKGAFFMSNIRSISMPNEMTEIPYDCFYECEQLEHIKWSEHLKIIREKALTNTMLREKGIPDGVEYVGSFSCAATDTFFIPSSVNYIAPDALLTCKTKYFQVSKENKNFIFIDGVLYNNDTTEIVAYPILKPDSVFIVPYSIHKIKDGLLMNNSNLRILYFHKKLKVEAYSAFNRHNISKIYLDWSVADDYDCIMEFLRILSADGYDVPSWDHYIESCGDSDSYYHLNHVDRFTSANVNFFYTKQYWMYYNYKEHRQEAKKYLLPSLNPDLKIYIPYGQKNTYIQLFEQVEKDMTTEEQEILMKIADIIEER